MLANIDIAGDFGNFVKGNKLTLLDIVGTFANKIKTLTLLDDFAFDPRNPACSEHANMNGGLYKAEIEEHNECEITVSAEMAREPVRIQFLSKATCDKFKAIIALNKPCCLEKFQQAVNEQVAQKTENK